MRLLKIKTRIAPYVEFTDWSPEVLEHFGPELLERSFPESLTVEVTAEGYPSDGPSRESEGWWLLSDESLEQQKNLPILLPAGDVADDVDPYTNGAYSEPEGNLWLFRGDVYFAKDQELTAEDVRALLIVETNKRRLMLEKAHALQAMTESYDKPRRRESISQPVRLEVWQRDGGRCVECNSQDRLEFDHIIPVSMGGANTARNIQLLCEACNRRKGASLG